MNGDCKIGARKAFSWNREREGFISLYAVWMDAHTALIHLLPSERRVRRDRHNTLGKGRDEINDPQLQLSIVV